MDHSIGNRILRSLPPRFCFFAKFRSISLLFGIALGLSVLCVNLTNAGIQWLSFTAFFLWPSWLLGAWIANLYRNGKIQVINIATLITALTISLILSLASRLNLWDSWMQYASWTGSIFSYLFTFLKMVIFLIGSEIHCS